ncbi:hypothetical protein CN918_25955 [Priestia megaterium]|nr:hypothetical protein CN918_25955 [Priestia megaterium]
MKRKLSVFDMVLLLTSLVIYIIGSWLVSLVSPHELMQASILIIPFSALITLLCAPRFFPSNQLLIVWLFFYLLFLTTYIVIHPDVIPRTNFMDKTPN